jgi:hypothetical protein
LGQDRALPPQGEIPEEILVEECRDAEEAERIAEHYRSIIANIRKQKEEQGG